MLADVPTLDEAGIQGIDGGVWIGLLAPANTPRAIIDKLSVAANEALTLPEVVKSFESQGIDPLGGTPSDFAKFIHDDIERWTKVLKAMGPEKKK